MVQSREGSFRSGSIWERDWWMAGPYIRQLDVKIIGSVQRGCRAISLVSLQLAGGEVMGEPSLLPRSCWAPGGAATGTQLHTRV